MGRRRKSKSSDANSRTRSADNIDENPDPDSRSFVYDEVDEFHDSRDKGRLSAVKRKDRQDSSSGEEEVLGVGSESGDSDNDANEENDDNSGMDSDIDKTERNYLPSADAWGRKRATFYNTDYVDEDYGGYSGSDAEAADFEEQEALTLQKRLAEQITEKDYELDIPTTSQTKPVEKTAEIEHIAPDIDKLSKEEQVELFKQQSPEMSGLLEDYNLKKNYLESVEPILREFRQNRIRNTKVFARFQSAIEAYGNYLVNIRFYLWMKAGCGLKDATSAKNHPVIDSIVQWKKIIVRADETIEKLKPQKNFLLEKLNQGHDLNEFLAPIELISESKNGIISGQGKTNELMEFGHLEDDYEDDDERRAITKEMADNRGLTPHKTKRYQRHSRVKRRKHFEKAKIKKRSQVADVRSETHRYGGEVRGIKAGLVRSVKLH